MIFRPELVDKILSGQKTETRRKVKTGETECRYKVGRTYAVQPGRGKLATARMLVTEVRREMLGFINDAAAKREGFDHRVPFFEYWRGLYGHVDMEQEVWVIRFVLTAKPKGGSWARLQTGGSGALLGEPPFLREEKNENYLEV